MHAVKKIMFRRHAQGEEPGNEAIQIVVFVTCSVVPCMSLYASVYCTLEDDIIRLKRCVPSIFFCKRRF